MPVEMDYEPKYRRDIEKLINMREDKPVMTEEQVVPNTRVIRSVLERLQLENPDIHYGHGPLKMYSVVDGWVNGK